MAPTGLAAHLAHVFQDLVILGLTLDGVLSDTYYTQLPRDLDVLEVFTEAESISNAAKKLGHRAEVFDFRNEGTQSITVKAGLHQAVRLVMRVRESGLVTLAPECKTFGFACSSITKRNKTRKAGDVKKPAVANGNQIARTAFWLFILAICRGVHACLENPSGSMLFSYMMNYIEKLRNAVSRLAAQQPPCQQLRPQYFLVDRCSFVSQRPTFKKTYKFLCSSDWFSPAVKRCNCPSGEHLQLMNQVPRGDGSFKINGTKYLKGSGLYPQALGESIVAAWLQYLSRPISTSCNSQADKVSHDHDHDPWIVGVPEVKKRPALKAALKNRTGKGSQLKKALSDDDFDPWA